MLAERRTANREAAIKTLRDRIHSHSDTPEDIHEQPLDIDANPKDSELLRAERELNML